MIAAVVCREMKWTWKEYLATPQPFVEIIVDMLAEEARAQERASRKQKNNSGAR